MPMSNGVEDVEDVVDEEAVGLEAAAEGDALPVEPALEAVVAVLAMTLGDGGARRADLWPKDRTAV